MRLFNCLLLFFFAVVCFFSACRPGGRSASVAIVSPHLQYSSSEFRAACATYEKDVHVDLYGVSEGQLPVFSVRELSRHSLVLFEGMGARISLLQPQIDSLKAVTRVLFLDSSIVQGNLSLRDYPALGDYWANGNTENYKGMLSFLAARFFGEEVRVIPPVRYPDHGFYYPGRDSLFHTAGEYLSWYDSTREQGLRRVGDSGRLQMVGGPKGLSRLVDSAGLRDPLTVGLVFYQTNYVKKDMRHIDALIRSIELHGARPVTLLAKSNFQLDSFFMTDHRSVVDVIIYGGMFLNFSRPEKGRAAAERLDVPLLGAVNHYLKSPLQWEKDPGGFAPDMSDRFFFTERDGVFEPINIAGAVTDKDGAQYTEPIDYQVNWRVERALAWARLRRTPNKEKRIVCTYYSEGSGKANVGADIDAYLDVPASLGKLLHTWRDSGYDVGKAELPAPAVLARLMSQYASNVGSWAPAELRRRAAAGEVVMIPEEEYLGWFHSYPADQQQQVIQHWGPAPGRLMTVTDSNGKKSIVIPILRYGNIILAPHPNWGLQDNPALIYGKDALPPTHAYIAFFEWMKRQYRPHAWLSLFTQLSLMPGKQEGPSAKDWVGELVGNIPHVSLSPLVANGGVSNKRRASALTIGYITPITTAGLSDSLQLLQRKVEEWQTATNPALKVSLERVIRRLGEQLGVDKEMGGGGSPGIGGAPGAERGEDGAGGATDVYMRQLGSWLRRLARQRMPLGDAVLGEAPKEETMVSMVEGMLGKEFTSRFGGDERHQHITAMATLRELLLHGRSPVAVDSVMQQQLKLALYYRDLLWQTPNEVTQVMRALDGRYIPSGPAGDPVNNPSVLPGGRDTYSGNDKAMPSKEAWELGRQMADGLLLQYERKHGRGAYPHKVAFVLWSSEITHTQGVMEAEILYLVGVRPVWNSKGQVMDVELIPAAELGRPRIDVLVTTSGTYRDHFGDKIRMLDRGVRLAAGAGGDSNWVAIHTTAYAHRLRGDAVTAAELRIFSSDVGAFSTNLEFAAEDGESWKKDTTLSSLYLNRMAFAYGQNVSGLYRRQLFELNIKDIDAAAFSRSSNVYGLMDHPMVAAYFGAYNLVVRNTTGRTPDLFINDLQDPATAEVAPIADEYHLELRGRYLNPKWIRGMMDHGYDGARYMEAFTEDLFLWNITSPDMVKTEDWNEVYATYLEDRNKLGLNHYFAGQNPYALQSMVSVMLESTQKGYWHASDEQLKTMAMTLASSVVKDGPTCNTAVCNSPGLSAYVTAIMGKVPGGVGVIRDYQGRLKQLKQTGGSEHGRPGGSGRSGAQPVSGREMTTEKLAGPGAVFSPSLITLVAGLCFLLLLFIAGWIRRP